MRRIGSYRTHLFGSMCERRLSHEIRTIFYPALSLKVLLLHIFKLFYRMNQLSDHDRNTDLSQFACSLSEDIPHHSCVARRSRMLSRSRLTRPFISAGPVAVELHASRRRVVFACGFVDSMRRRRVQPRVGLQCGVCDWCGRRLALFSRLLFAQNPQQWPH
jgi:hypothetical protein